MAFATSGKNQEVFCDDQLIRKFCILELAISSPCLNRLPQIQSTDQGCPLHRPSSYIRADLDSGFHIDTAGLTSTLHKQLADVGRTLSFPKQITHAYVEKSYAEGEKRIEDYESTNELHGPSVNYHLSFSSQYLPTANRSVSRAIPYPADHNRHSLSSGIDCVLFITLWRLVPMEHFNR